MNVPVEALRRIKEGRQTLILRSGPVCRYEPGRYYQLKTQRDRPSTVGITITAKDQVQANSLDLRAARRLGHRTCADMIEAWPKYDPMELIWLLSFEIGDVSDTPRLLAARPGPGHGDYVSTTVLAAKGEQEGISAHTADKYAQASREQRLEILGRQRKRALMAIAEIRPYAESSREFKRLRAAENQIRTLDNLPKEVLS